MKKEENLRLTLTTLLALVSNAMASELPAGRTETLTDFVQQEWRLQNFKVGRDSVLSTIPMRVSTYSSPTFIHRGQMENLRWKSDELANLCKRQGGSWNYTGATLPTDKSLQAKTGASSALTNQKLADAVKNASVSDSGMQAIVQAGEQSLTADVAKMIVQSMLTQTDALVAETLEYAVGQKWLGSFQCQGPSSTWTATISYSKWANRMERSLVYKDVTLKIELTEK